MSKAGKITAVLVGMLMVLGTAMSASAEEEMKSCGTFRFQSAAGTVQILAEDITLLRGKLSGMPEEPFDAAYYSEVHAE